MLPYPPPDLDLGRLFWRLPDPSLVVDGRRQVPVLGNPPAAHLLGYPAAEREGAPAGLPGPAAGMRLAGLATPPPMKDPLRQEA